MEEPKKLYRSNKDRMLCGVCGGIGEYFNVDPTMIRLLWVVITAITGFLPGIIAYIVCCIIVPEEPEEKAQK